LRILLLHDNARPHIARATIDALETPKFEVLSHSPYSPDLAPSDFHFFPQLKRDLKGTHFTSDDEVKQAVTSWIKQRTPEFFIDGMHKLVLRWEKCIERQGDYVEK
jgi:transposase